jgi:hypothetical protein
LPEQSSRASNRKKEEPNEHRDHTRRPAISRRRGSTLDDRGADPQPRRAQDVEDALAELHASGLVNRINKRVVCASRAAIRADELNS